jgi:lipopolysaccharide/colanic/teichoic acid biosynthesis glycosyltransferase
LKIPAFLFRNLLSIMETSRPIRLKILFFLVNFLLVGFSFLVLNFFKRDSFFLSSQYLKLFFCFYVIWLISVYITNKYQIQNFVSPKAALFTIIKSNSFLLYGLAILMVLMGLTGFSRLHVFGSCCLLASLELAFFLLFFYSGGRQHFSGLEKEYEGKHFYQKFNIRIFVLDFLFFMVAFFALNYFKRDTLALSLEYQKILILMTAVWFSSGIITRKFAIKSYQNYYHRLSPYLKAFFLSFASMAVLVLAFRMFFYSRLQILGTFVLLLTLEGIFHFFLYLYKIKNQETGDVETVEEVQQILRQETLAPRVHTGKNKHQQPIYPVINRIKNQYLKAYPLIFEFINERIDLSKIDLDEAIVLNTHTPYNIEMLEDSSLDLFVNLHLVNDFRHLNRYFLEVHRKFFNGGYLVGRAHTIATHKKLFYRKFPRELANLLYPLNFLFFRLLPKLPLLKKVYFFFSRGRNRLISQAELIGRLCFCGFQVVDTREIKGSLYYIARKVKQPSLEKNPSYGPLIKLRRIGFNGQPFYVYKFRTMHPYAEFMQDYIYQQNNLENSGKFKDDFRLTEWGKVFRKLWIDELPQFLNYFHGDLNLFGVRALSEHYFNLYPEDLRTLRIQFKPGLVPPYYADLPVSFEEVIESERRYLEQKQKNPLVTDVKYFSKAVYNIVFKNARSR